MKLAEEIQKMSWKAGGGDSKSVFNDLLQTIMQSLCVKGKHLIEKNTQPLKGGDAYRDALGELLKKLGDYLETKPYEDAFGDCFMELFSNNYKGQFLTPQCIARFMSSITLNEANKEIKPTINDPACGSGRTLLCAAESLKRNCILVGQDIDQYCVWMATCNFLLHSLEGDIIHGNTLTQELYAIYKVRLHPILRLPYLIVEDLRHIKNVIALAKEEEAKTAKKVANRKGCRKITEEDEE